MTRVTALGSGDAFNSAGRAHTCWLVQDGRGAFAVDFGATALMSLKKLKFDPDRLQAVHFTHLHGDHIAGWPFLLVDAVYRSKRAKPLEASGPPGTRERLHALWAACYRRAAEKPLPFPLTVHELEPGQSAVIAGREVTAFAAQHMTPPDVALSLRIEDLAFTGDTGAIAGGLCDGAKLLCAECTELTAPDSRLPAPARHLNWEELQHALPDVPMIALGHLGEAARAAIPRDRVIVCEDLEVIEARESGAGSREPNMDRIEQLNKFIEAQPDEPFPRYALALEKRSKGDQAGAAADLEELLRRKPDYLAAYLMLGMLQQALGRPDEARETFGKGQSLARTKGDTHTLSELTSALEGL